MKFIDDKKKMVSRHTYIHTYTRTKKKERKVSSVSSHSIKTRIEKKKVSRHTYINTHTHTYAQKKEEKENKSQ